MLLLAPVVLPDVRPTVVLLYQVGHIFGVCTAAHSYLVAARQQYLVTFNSNDVQCGL